MLAVCVITVWFWSNIPANYSKWVPKAHHPIEFNMIWKAMLIPSMGYIVGLILGLIVYRKPRKYEERNINDRATVTELKPYILVVTVIAI